MRKNWAQLKSLSPLYTQLGGLAQKWISFVHQLSTRKFDYAHLSKQAISAVLYQPRLFFYTFSTGLSNTIKLNKLKKVVMSYTNPIRVQQKQTKFEAVLYSYKRLNTKINFNFERILTG